MEDNQISSSTMVEEPSNNSNNNNSGGGGVVIGKGDNINNSSSINDNSIVEINIKQPQQLQTTNSIPINIINNSTVSDDSNNMVKSIDSGSDNDSDLSSPHSMSIPMQLQKNKSQQQLKQINKTGSTYVLDNNSIASSSSNSNSPTGLVNQIPLPYTPDGVTIKRPIMSSTNLEQKQSSFSNNIETEDGESKKATTNGYKNDKLSSFSPKFSSKIAHAKKPSVFPCLIVVLFEILIGLGTMYPLVIGIIRNHVTLLIYGCFGALFLVFAIGGFFSLLNIKPLFLKIFYYWKFVSLGLIIFVTIAVGVLSYYKDPLVVNNWWASLILCIGIAVLFFMWTITCILWIRPLIKEIRSVESVVLKEMADEENTKDTSSDLDIDTLDQLTIKPQYGQIQPEEPLRIAMRKFNKNPQTGIQFIQENNLLLQTPYRDIVTFLYNVDGLNKVKVGDYLGENDPININILKQFVEQYNFNNKKFDESLREFLSKFRLPGEAQKIDRIMESFARKYHRDNPGTFPDSDTAYLLAFSLILLNTDAHNPAIKNKMAKKSFVANNTGFKGKKDLPIEYLESLYDRIINCELKMDSDSLFSNALIKGWLNKMTSNEKTWQRRWFVLKNNCLYYFKNEKDEDHPKVIIPLEGLKVTLLSDLIFEIEDSTVGTIKSVKLMPSGPIEGQHAKYLLKAHSIEEANKWVDSIRNNVLGSPVLQLIKKKKKILNRPSGGHGNRRKSVSNEYRNSSNLNSSGNRGSGSTPININNSNGGGASSNGHHQSGSSESPVVGRESHNEDTSVNGSLKSDDYLTTETDIYGSHSST